jgi:hypothetical protein
MNVTPLTVVLGTPTSPTFAAPIKVPLVLTSLTPLMFCGVFQVIDAPCAPRGERAREAKRAIARRIFG